MSQTPPSVREWFPRYLDRQIVAQAEGLGLADPDGQVVPHETTPLQPIDPQLAWEDALAVVRWIKPSSSKLFSLTITSGSSASWEVPPDWPSFVAVQEPAVALAFCVGNFPQMVRDVQPLLTSCNPQTLRPRAEYGNGTVRPVAVPPALLQWTKTVQGYPQLFVAAGVLRLARRFGEAIELLRSHGRTPAAWQALRANEEAALAWHRGDAQQALAQWQTQKPSVPVLFNRGMAALFLGHPNEARTALEQAVAGLPETSAWHHLGRLYLALNNTTE